MRRKDEKRKDHRQEKKERMEEEKRRKQEELNVLKQMKRDEILEKLRKAEFLSGSKLTSDTADKRLLEKLEKELRTEFIPELYDRAMEKMFDEKYYEAEDSEGKAVVEAKNIDLKLMKDEELNEEEEVIPKEEKVKSSQEAIEEEENEPVEVP